MLFASTYLRQSSPQIATIFTLRRADRKLALILPYRKLLAAVGKQYVRVRQWTA